MRSLDEMKFETVIGYWNDRENEDDIFCVGVAIVPPDTPDETTDALLDRDDVFFVFTEDETLLANHGEFTLVAAMRYYAASKLVDGVKIPEELGNV